MSEIFKENRVETETLRSEVSEFLENLERSNFEASFNYEGSDQDALNEEKRYQESPERSKLIELYGRAEKLGVEVGAIDPTTTTGARRLLGMLEGKKRPVY